MINEESQQRIYQVIHSIPAGRVATYGQVATLAGLPGAARLVGRLLSRLPAETRLPWHRVINSQGRLSLPAGTSGYRQQRRLLEAEGVEFRGEKLNLLQFRWSP